MAGTGFWAKVHKWLALLMALQILFWFASGLFFAWFPIERVRSEHAKAAQAARARAAGRGGGGAGPAARRQGVTAAETRRGPAAARAAGRLARARARAGRVLYDLADAPAALADPVTLGGADRRGRSCRRRCARRGSAGVEAETTEYRGALPAWRVDFEDGEGRAIYVAADTGAVTARRSTLWRAYDFLWGLHIMDWRGHEDFNSWLLVIATVLGLVVVLSGIVLLPSRLGLDRWLRRRRSYRAGGGGGAPRAR